jgi:hypothetical protein
MIRWVSIMNLDMTARFMNSIETVEIESRNPTLGVQRRWQESVSPVALAKTEGEGTFFGELYSAGILEW